MRNFLTSIATGLDKLAKAASEAERRSHAYKVRTTAKLNQPWFPEFQASILAALRIAKSRADLNEKLESNPELKKEFLKVKREFSKNSPDDHEEAKPTETQVPAWAKLKPPEQPQNLPNDPLERQLHFEAFDEARKEHEALLNKVCKELQSRPMLREPFEEALTSLGLKHLYRRYFEQTSRSAKHNSPPAGGLPEPSPRRGARADEVRNIHSKEQSNVSNPRTSISDGRKRHADEEKPLFISRSSSRIFEPPLDELSRLPAPLEPGERVVLDFFDRNLNSDWEIYIQPHLNGLRPDFVLLYSESRKTRDLMG